MNNTRKKCDFCSAELEEIDGLFTVCPSCKRLWLPGSSRPMEGTRIDPKTGEKIED